MVTEVAANSKGEEQHAPPATIEKTQKKLMQDAPATSSERHWQRRCKISTQKQLKPQEPATCPEKKS